MRCMFNPDIKCDYINNNLAESFNAWVRDIKDLPIVQLADKIREVIMDLFRKRRMIGEKFLGTILPFVIHQLNAKTRGLGHLKAKASADWSGEVRNVNKGDERHVVKTLTHECTCLQWQHTGKPCDHALAFINVLQARNFVNMEDYVHDYYPVSRFRAAYEGVIEPLTDKNQWPHVDTGFVLLPPIPKGKKKGAGRTRKQRMKSWWEGGSRKGSLNKCKKCGEVGHREAGCPQNGTKKRKSRGERIHVHGLMFQLAMPFHLHQPRARMMPLVAVLELSQEAKLHLKLVLDLSQGAKLLLHHKNLQQKERRRK